jgi:hypothetical protein
MASSVYAVLMKVIGRDEKVPVHAMKLWGVEVCLHSFLTSALDGFGRSASRPGYFTSEETPISIEGWVGPRTSLRVLEKREICCGLRE